MYQSTGQQRETQKVGRELIEVRRVAIQRDSGWFFLLVRLRNDPVPDPWEILALRTFLMGFTM